MAFDENDCYYINVSEKELEQLIYSRTDSIFLSVIFPLLLLVGLASNAAFIYVVVHVAYMRTITNYYLVSLSVADVFFLLFTVGDKIFRYWMSPVKNDSIYGSFGCGCATFFWSMTYFASIGFVTLVSVERYSAVCRPTQVFSGKVTAKQRARNLIIVNTLLSALLASTFVPGNIEYIVACYNWPENATNMPDASGMCFPVNQNVTVVMYTYGVQTLPFFVAFVFNVFLYARILSELKKRERNIERSENALVDSTKRRNQITMMLIVNGILFFLLLAPFEIISLIWMFTGIITPPDQTSISDEPIVLLFADIARSLSYLNSAINVLVYTALSPRYTKAFSDTYCSLCRGWNCPSRGSYQRADESNTNETRTTANL